MFYSHHCSQVDPRHDSPTPKSAPREAEGEQGVQGIWSAEMGVQFALRSSQEKQRGYKQESAVYCMNCIEILEGSKSCCWNLKPSQGENFGVQNKGKRGKHKVKGDVPSLLCPPHSHLGGDPTKFIKIIFLQNQKPLGRKNYKRESSGTEGFQISFSDCSAQIQNKDLTTCFKCEPQSHLATSRQKIHSITSCKYRAQCLEHILP